MAAQSKIRNAGHVVCASVGRARTVGEGGERGCWVQADGTATAAAGGGICSDSASIIDKRSIWRLRAAPAGQTG